MAKKKLKKIRQTFTLDKSTVEQLNIVAKKTHRSQSNVVDLILTRALHTFIKEPELL